MDLFVTTYGDYTYIQTVRSIIFAAGSLALMISADKLTRLQQPPKITLSLLATANILFNNMFSCRS